MIYENYDELCRKTKRMPINTDLLAFTNLYKRFGIECKIKDCEEGYKIVFLSDGQYSISLDPYTRDKRLVGFKGSTSGIVFDQNGKFLNQGLW